MTQPAALASTMPATTAGWLVLALGDRRLALPQRAIRLIGLVSDLKPSAGESLEVGWLPQKSGDAWPVYCFDEALDLQHPVPEGRHICAFIEAGGGIIGLLSDRVWSLAADADVAVEPLPACMTGLPSPVVGIARHPESVVTVLGAAEIAAYLNFLRERAHGADQ